MTTQRNENINNLLQEADIEGLITAGAPADEYDSEAAAISLALREMDNSQINTDSITAVIAAIWAKSFHLDENGIHARLPAIKTLAERITR